MSINSADLRNITISGHNGTGKTALSEQILFYGDRLQKAEFVESGKTFSDYTEEEIKRQISVHSALGSFEWNGKTVNILDTPGTADFIGEAICAFRSTESAVMVVDGRDGAQIETIKLWRRLDGRNKPRLVFINKLDRERSNYAKALENLGTNFKVNFVPISIPMGEADSYKGVIDLIHNKAYLAKEGEKEIEVEIPSEYADSIEEFRSKLIENVAECSDDLMEKFFEEGTLTAEEIAKGLKIGFKKNEVVPVFAGCTKIGSGITSLLNFIEEDAPSPLGRIEHVITKEKEEKEIVINDKDAISAYVFKTSIDQFSGKLSFLKVIGGVLTPDTDLINAETGKKERPGKLYRAIGKKLIEVSELPAGDIGIMTKSNSAVTNTTLLTNSNQKFAFKPVRFPAPVYSLAISALDKKSEDKMNDSLHKVTEEDQTFQVSFNEETKESVVAGMGELHINMILEKIKEKQKISINTKLPRIAYRETITKKSGLAEYAHKKQSGGHGQYGKVVIEIEPIERGEYYSFTNSIKGGSISKGYVPGIEKGLHESMEDGFLAGYPLVDIGINLIDGKEHPVDSSEMAFRLAAKGAMKVAIEKAGPVLLEPFMKLSVFIENKYLGDILSDLSGKRGRVLGQEDIGGDLMEVSAEVPQAELLNYAIDLKSMTSGTGSFEVEFDHYETLNGKLAQDVINDSKEAAEAEK